LGSRSSKQSSTVRPDFIIEQIDLLNDEIPHHLQDLFNHLEQQNPQLGLAWMKNLARYSSEPGELANIFVACKNGSSNEFVALPLFVGANREARSLGNFYTSLTSPASSIPDALSLLTALLLHLKNSENLSAIVLSPLDQDNPLFPQLLSSLKDAGWSGRHDFFCFGNWIEPIQENSWQHYFQSRPSKLRNTVERKARAFLRDGKGEFTVIRGGEELANGIEQYSDIYENSWKINEPHPGFMPQLIELAAQKNWLRLGIARYEGRAIAAQVWLVANGTAYIFKLAYHEDFSRLSAGTLLTAHLMQYVIEQDNVEAIDYLSGDDAYKKDWMSIRRERFGIAAYNASSATGLLKLTAFRLATIAKRLGLRPRG
jgi:ribosomal protein S18 acetylase RimI-like enzyme